MEEYKYYDDVFIDMHICRHSGKDTDEGSTVLQLYGRMREPRTSQYRQGGLHLHSHDSDLTDGARLLTPSAKIPVQGGASSHSTRLWQSLARETRPTAIFSSLKCFAHSHRGACPGYDRSGEVTARSS
jgi:hypothetical protein